MLILYLLDGLCFPIEKEVCNCLSGKKYFSVKKAIQKIRKKQSNKHTKCNAEKCIKQVMKFL